MLIPIHIPIGTKHVAAVQGSVWKVVTCTHCQQRYAYLLELEATGEDHDLFFLDGEGSAERARAHAEQNFLQKSRNCILPVACPICGFYQDEMAQRLKEDAWINPQQVIGAAIALASLVPLAFDIAYNWVATLILGVLGLFLVVYGYVLTIGFDPNAGDAESRKALGRSRSIWGEQLDELLAANPGIGADSRAKEDSDVHG